MVLMGNHIRATGPSKAGPPRSLEKEVQILTDLPQMKALFGEFCPENTASTTDWRKIRNDCYQIVTSESVLFEILQQKHQIVRY